MTIPCGLCHDFSNTVSIKIFFYECNFFNWKKKNWADGIVLHITIYSGVCYHTIYIVVFTEIGTVIKFQAAYIIPFLVENISLLSTKRLFILVKWITFSVIQWVKNTTWFIRIVSTRKYLAWQRKLCNTMLERYNLSIL